MKLYNFKLDESVRVKMMRSSLIVVWLSMISSLVFSQDRCGTHLNLNMSAYIPQHLQTKTSARSSKFEIPVVFHVFTLIEQEPLSDRKIFEQIDILNENYDQVNAPNALYMEAALLASDPNVSFYLADSDPDGMSTTGIIHYHTSNPSLGNIPDGEEPRSVMNELLGGTNPWDTDRYLNIYIAPRNDGILGDSSFPKTGNKEEDGVVIKNNVVGYQSSNDRFALGKTLVHEIGHYLGLRHPFGSNELCEDNDGIEDTPIQNQSYFGCPEYPQESCESLDLIYNYMDFHDDSCLRFFTKGQVELIHHTLSTCRNELVSQVPPTTETNNNINEITLYNNGEHVIIHDSDFKSLNIDVRLIDLNGRMIRQIRASKESTIKINSFDLASGIYLLLIERENNYDTRKIFISN